VLLAGCAHRPDLSERVGRVRFDGNGSLLEGTSDFHLRQAMEQEKGSWSTFIFKRNAVPLDRRTLTADAWRIELWYAHHGYFDASFLGWDVRQRRRERRRRPAVLDITGRVEQGEPSLVRSLSFEGLDLGGGGVHRRYIELHSDVLEGERFSLEAVHSTAALVRSWLQEHGHAWVEVYPKVDAYPEEHVVDVHFRVEPGVACRFGEVSVHGDEAVPELFVRDQVEVRTGRPYKASSLAETRRNLFALGTFSAVSVTPGRIEGSEDLVPVQVHLTETRFRRLRLGAGLGAESGQQDAHVSVGVLHNNLFHRMLQLESDNQVGVAAIAAYSDLLDHQVERWAPVVDNSIELTFPRIFGPGWSMSQLVAFEMGLESGYTFLTPSWEPAVSYAFEPGEGGSRALGNITLTASHKLSYFDYLDTDVQLDAINESRLGLDVTDPYILSFTEQQVVWDQRDDLLFTTRGAYVAAALGMAGGPFANGAPFFGQFDFVKGQADLRLFTSLAPLLRLDDSFVLATRLAGGMAQPLGSGDRAAVPYAERFKIGGGNTVRGWPTDHLGPRLCERSVGSGEQYTEFSARDVCDDIIPIGGRLYGLGSVELRKSLRSLLHFDLGVVGFVDAGMAWNDWASVSQQPPLPSAGFGLRYASPVGPVRVDLGFRLDQDEDFADPEFDSPRLNLHFSLSEAF